jgi:hypothetical protein
MQGLGLWLKFCLGRLARLRDQELTGTGTGRPDQSQSVKVNERELKCFRDKQKKCSELKDSY